MGQCTSKHGVRKEGAKDPNDLQRNLVANLTSTALQDNDTLLIPSGTIDRNKTTVRGNFNGNQNRLSSLEEENQYSSDFCEEEEGSFTTADSSSRSMRYPTTTTSRKNSSGLSRKTSSVTPSSSYSPNKMNSTSTSYLSPSDSRDENGDLNSSPIRDMVKKPGCEMFVIDFEDDIPSISSPNKRVPLSCMYNKKQQLQSASATNSPKKKMKRTVRNDKVSDVQPSSTIHIASSKRGRKNDKAENVNRNIEPSTYSANKTGSRHNNQEPSKIHSSNNKNSHPNSKGCSVLKEVVSGNKKFKKDLMNEKIKSQDSPKRTFLKKKLKDKHQPRVPPNDGKLK